MNRKSPESDPSEPLAPGLYIVATPIGNLGDITFRAVDTLTRCDAVACEDTRVAGKLLKHLGISRPLIRHDDHAGPEACEALVSRMHREAIVLVSDAGTPLISDPGFRLVRAARCANVKITTIPGPCAAIAGLTLSGLPTDRFLFAGFLPTKDKARNNALQANGEIEATIVFYESGPRLVKSLEAIGALWPQRGVAVARELTKLFEECRTGSAAELAAHYRDNPPKGEIVLMVGPAAENHAHIDPDELLREALADLKPSQAAAQVAKATKLNRKALYTRALELKSE